MPQPVTARSIVDGIRYKPGWGIRLGGPDGRYLCATSTNPDSAPPHQPRSTGHMFPLPAWALGPLASPSLQQQLVRWIFDRLLDAERHEAGEWFSWKHHRVFFPAHAEGDPYARREHWPDQ